MTLMSDFPTSLGDNTEIYCAQSDNGGSHIHYYADNHYRIYPTTLPWSKIAVDLHLTTYSITADQRIEAGNHGAIGFAVDFNSVQDINKLLHPGPLPTGTRSLLLNESGQYKKFFFTGLFEVPGAPVSYIAFKRPPNMRYRFVLLLPFNADLLESAWRHAKAERRAQRTNRPVRRRLRGHENN